MRVLTVLHPNQSINVKSGEGVGCNRDAFIEHAMNHHTYVFIRSFRPPHPSISRVKFQAAKDEFARAVVGRGTVVRCMRDGSTQMLFVTGIVG